MRRKATIYLDTSVPGAFLGPPDSPVYKATATFWDNVLPDYDAYISELVEIEIADLKNISRRKKLESLIRKFKVLEVSQEAVEVSQEYLKLLRIPENVKHIGLSGILAIEGKLDYEKVIEHFIKVNNCDRNVFEKHRDKAFEKWRARSSHNWQVDLGEYKNIVQRRC